MLKSLRSGYYSVVFLFLVCSLDKIYANRAHDAILLFFYFEAFDDKNRPEKNKRNKPAEKVFPACRHFPRIALCTLRGVFSAFSVP